MAHPTATTPRPLDLILVVDDEPALRSALRMIVEREGDQVVMAADGAEAIPTVHKRHPAVLLVDLHRPEIDGWQAYEQIRALAPALPVIFMSATTHAERKARAHQAAGAVPTPFAVDQVLETVARFLPKPAAAR